MRIGTGLEATSATRSIPAVALIVSEFGERMCNCVPRVTVSVATVVVGVTTGGGGNVVAVAVAELVE
jgi:hypothetical protein